MRLLNGSGSEQSKQRVDGKDWLVTLCNWWSNKAVRVTKTELTKTNKQTNENMFNAKSMHYSFISVKCIFKWTNAIKIE